MKDGVLKIRRGKWGAYSYGMLLGYFPTKKEAVSMYADFNQQWEEAA